MKKQIPVRVEESLIDKLKEHSVDENRTFSNHVETILKSDVEKRELPKPFVSKQEYKS